MKTLYLDIFSGISGDMFIGAMLDLGVDAHEFEHELEKLGLRDYHLHVSRQERGAIAGTKFDVHLAHEHGHSHSHEHGHGSVTHTHEHEHFHSHQHQHDDAHHHVREDDTGHHDHLEGAIHGPHGGVLVETKVGRVELSVFETGAPPRFRLYFFDRHGHAVKPPAAASVQLKTVRSRKQRQKFKFVGRKEYLEATDLLPEPHEFTAVLKIQARGRREEHEVAFTEEHHHQSDHDHSDSHEHEHGRGRGEHHEHGRTFSEIRGMIQRSALSSWVKEKSIAIFHRIAIAEGKIHGHPPEQVHFHEVGAVDSIVDIAGACIALEMLGKPRVLAGHPVEGTGTIRCAHGIFPIPAPATLEILSARRVSIEQCEEPGELITPTGAAILAEFAIRFGPLQNLVVERIGYGLGTRENKTRPNVMRALLGVEAKVPDAKVKATAGPNDWETDTVAVLETNLDDINPELLGAFVEGVLAAGALDVFHTPVQMKKNRPGTLLTVLCAGDESDRFSEMILRQTTAFGVRRTFAERRKLQRASKNVKTPFGMVAVKLGRLNGRTIQISPEFESCRSVAQQAGVTVREVYQAALKAIE